MNRYLLFEKERLRLDKSWKPKWDLFVSAPDESARVTSVDDRVRARLRIRVALPEYGYSDDECQRLGITHRPEGGNEAEIIDNLLSSLDASVELSSASLVIDITGLIGHYVMVLVAQLARRGVTTFDVLYAEPIRYVRSEATLFSDQAVMIVRQVAGYEGIHVPDTSDDLLVLGVGYEDRLMAEVANHKDHARKVQVFGLPSLRADMYQESVLRASRIADAVGAEASHPRHFRFAPAYDPFVTAGTIAEVVAEHRSRHPAANVYVAPLSTKVQALGAALYYVWECDQTATSVIFPICYRYQRATSEGVAGAWRYKVEIPNKSIAVL